MRKTFEPLLRSRRADELRKAVVDLEAEQRPAPVHESDNDAHFAVAKSNDEKRYTFGVLYTPGELDSHGEYTDAASLQKATWDYVRRGDLTIRGMHNRDILMGEMVEIVSWPFPVEAELSAPGVDARKVSLPANTVFVGVIWSEEMWPLIKSGEIAGYSLGGKTVRVDGADDLPRMGE